VNYSYDNADRLLQITQGTSVVSFSYDAASRRMSLTLPNGVVESYTYDAASQLSAINYQLAGNALGNLSHAYDLAGRRTQVGGSFARTGIPLPVSTTAYNTANELTQWGTATLTYDANGNMLSTGSDGYTWDARNHLVSTLSGASLQYDPFGRRVSKTISGATTNYLYDGLNPVQELSGGTPTANLVTGPNVDEHFLRTDSSGPANFLTDPLGSTVALADSSGAVQTTYTYEPFGNTTAAGAANANPYQYTGRENDATGLYYFRARYYSPVLQRFTSQDPIGFLGGDANLYAYVWSSPTDFIDPLGWWGFGVSAAGSVEGGVYAVGAGATGSAGAGAFFDGFRPSAGGFASGGAFAGGPGRGWSAPGCPNKNNWAAGAYAGGGGNVFVTNANNVSDLSGPFKTYSLNVGWGVRLPSIQYSVGQNAAGQTTRVFSYGGPLPTGVPTGAGYGASVSAYNTNTTTTAGRGCGCR
jgi:RHS repeat-associated protein